MSVLMIQPRLITYPWRYNWRYLKSIKTYISILIGYVWLFVVVVATRFLSFLLSLEVHRNTVTACFLYSVNTTQKAQLFAEY